MMRFLSVLCLLTMMAYTVAEEPQWKELATGTQASLRGLSVAARADGGQPVVWAAGAKGTILISLDLGKQWQSIGPANYPEVEFRSLHAWDERTAIVASAGTPAIVLKTTDAGKTWREVYRDTREKAFFDGLKFIDQKRGVLFGDPIDGRFTVLTTKDAGETWQAIAREALPPAREGEAAFAASNSAMIVAEPESIWIGTGGCNAPQSRVLVSHDFGKSWLAHECPLASSASSGIFSLARGSDPRQLVAVGGDYQPDANSPTTGAVSIDRGEHFALPIQPPRAFRSAVVFSQGMFYATGPTGTDRSPDGLHWTKLSDVGYHALAALPDGSIVAVGSNGRFGRL